MKTYGLTVEEFDALIIGQSGRCSVCERPLAGTPHVDHDHTTGAVRGILCFNCNGGLGQLGDDPARLRAALAYLLDAAGRQAGPECQPHAATAATTVAPVIDIHPPAYAEGDRVRWHAPATSVVEYTYRHARTA